MITPIPQIQSLSDINFQEPEIYTLDNGLVVYGFNGAGKDIIKISLYFDAGRWTEDTPLSASFCANLLKSGTEQQSAYEISEEIDFSGSTIKISAGYNSFTISLYCLTRHLSNCLPILDSILNDTIFPESEIEHSKMKRKASLEESLLKNDYVGDIEFKKLLFGAIHPYGYSTSKKAIKKTSREDILSYYKTKLFANNCAISIAGKFNKPEIDLINKFFGDNNRWKKTASVNQKAKIIETSTELKKVFTIPNSVQASIFIGNLTIDRSHQDTHALAMLNMIFGGYFGSRLMTNIREDKGLTYGIYSYIQRYKYASAFIINTDTGLENIDTCIKEIYFEMTRLKEELISDEELLKAKNYYLGRLLDQADGPFKSEATYMGLLNHGFSTEILKDLIKSIKNIEPKTLLETAQKYFVTEEMFEVIVR